MEALTPASPGDLPPLGELVADEPLWRHPACGLAAEGVAHLRIWTTATDPPGHLAVVTETGLGAPVTESAGRIWADLVRRYGPSLVLLEHHRAPELAEGVETLDLVRIGADGSPHWSRVWSASEENPRPGRLRDRRADRCRQAIQLAGRGRSGAARSTPGGGAGWRRRR
jgi:hypothetical protein